MINSKFLVHGQEYTICGTIGKGAAGTVYLARDNKGINYALKVITNFKDFFVKQMVETQIRIQKIFQGNKYIIQYIGIEKTEKVVYIVLELGECSLGHWMQAHRQIPQSQIISMICNVSQGLIQIHSKNIIHRDIKPENIIKKDNYFKISDFGSSNDAKEQNQLMVGTPIYWPPQILLNESERITKKVDIWSLGVTIFQAYFKIHPFCPQRMLQKIDSLKNLKLQLLVNISQLTPNFSVGKVINFLYKYKLDKQAQELIQRVKKTDKTMTQNICKLLQPNPNLRPSIQQVYKLFQQRQSVARNPQFKKTKKKQIDQLIPDDILLFCKAKDAIYEVNQFKKSKWFEPAIFALEIYITALQNINYECNQYVELDYGQKIKKLKNKSKIDVHNEIRTTLSQFYFSLIFDQEYKKYYKINQLRVYVLVCSVWNRILKDSYNFCDKMSIATNMQIDQPMRIFEFLQMYPQNVINKIQDHIVTHYYS